MSEEAEVSNSNTPAFDAKSPVQEASRIALQGAAVGLVLSSVQNALGTHSHGAMGVVTRTGGTIGFFAAMGAAFKFTETYVANERQKNDALNGAAGGCAAGFLAGLRSRSLPMALGGCAFLGLAIGGFDYTGQLTGSTETKDERRKRFFKSPPPPLVEVPSE
ncbi:hypothetical protein JR316_0001059 [Psilocybe cubensis]|uniref:Uncharacterized protein n=2 Tax=Psilocybe cubensis TaxID=181762 RepID=A0ACB8HG41_PSICU|nr:hypothetical protein JR316_0001059 [Psilocybe cubensis]KAH9486993.1 hypothetical protein JR316_0001059 [Psilocybe cubensis]